MIASPMPQGQRHIGLLLRTFVVAQQKSRPATTQNLAATNCTKCCQVIDDNVLITTGAAVNEQHRQKS